MLRKLLIVVGALMLVAVAIGGVLNRLYGLSYELDGGGSPHLAFVESSASQAARIERHRAEQRARATAEPLPAAVPSAPVAAPEATTASSAATTPAIKENTPSAPSWTDFRGPRRDGIYREGPLALDWPSTGPPPVWKQPSGAGYASFVVAGNRAFTIEQRGGNEVVAAYDVATGRELWSNSWPAAFRESMGGDGPRATPTWFDGRVYALGATGELRALEETSGKMLWRTNILADAAADNLAWGMAAAPLIVGDGVVVLPGGASQSVVSYHRLTGKKLWSAPGEPQAYASPMLVTLVGVPQIVIFGSSRLVGLANDGSRQLWEFPWPVTNGINASQPIQIGNNRLFLSSSYGAGAAVIELSNADGAFSVREVWRNTRMKNRFASSVLKDGVIYGLDESILAAIDAATGDLKWKAGRYGYGQLVLADDRLIVLTEDGDLALVRATPEKHDELVRFKALEGKTWNAPAIAGGYLLIRNLAEMAAFDLRTTR